MLEEKEQELQETVGKASNSDTIETTEEDLEKSTEIVSENDFTFFVVGLTPISTSKGTKPSGKVISPSKTWKYRKENLESFAGFSREETKIT